MAAGAGSRPPIAWAGRARIGVRLTVMLGWLTFCVLFYYAWRVAGARNFWPRVFLGGIAWLAGVDVCVIGSRPQRGAFLLANHVSWIDILALAGASGTAFIAHDGLAVNPLLRWLCQMNDTVFIARDKRASVARQVSQIREALRGTGALTIFPEGTTSDGTGLLPFKSSLLSAIDPVPPGIVVQPVFLDYGREAAEIAWVANEAGEINFMRILARAQPLTLIVHFLTPLGGPALSNRKTMAAAAHAAIRDAMQQRDQRVTL